MGLDLSKFNTFPIPYPGDKLEFVKDNKELLVFVIGVVAPPDFIK